MKPKTMRKIKVGVDIRDLRIARTGARTFLEAVCNEFKKGHEGFEFHFIDTMLPVYTGKNKLLKIIEQLRFIAYKQLYLPLVALIKGCDIVFCTDFFVPVIKLGYQTIPVFHDAFFWQYPAHYNKYWLYTFNKLGVKAAKKAAYIITPTLHAKHTILTYLDIDPGKIAPVQEAPKNMDNCFSTAPPVNLIKGNYFLHVGVFEKRKNLVRLVEAYSMLKAEGFDHKLVLCGQFSPKSDMDDSRQVLEIVKKNGLENDVIMPGYVQDGDLAAYYENAFAYVFPSVNEGFGLPVLEAFRYKVPVIIADNSSLPEVGGDAVLSFDPLNVEDIANKMRVVMNDHVLRKEMIAKGTERLREFSWEITTERILGLFKTASEY
ncbi:MAG: glycosyltransferase family 1 protein [Pedobacter sp.]|nr:MAG: glycosyltransferase family 1 protein [Pedobacter sp.]